MGLAARACAGCDSPKKDAVRLIFSCRCLRATQSCDNNREDLVDVAFGNQHVVRETRCGSYPLL